MSDEYFQNLKAEIQTEKIKNKQRTEKKEILYERLATQKIHIQQGAESDTCSKRVLKKKNYD